MANGKNGQMRRMPMQNAKWQMLKVEWRMLNE